jgi:hypothetical protein
VSAWNSEPIATLPADDRKLKALAGAAESWATEKQAVLDCFEVEGGGSECNRLWVLKKSLNRVFSSASMPLSAFFSPFD